MTKTIDVILLAGKGRNDRLHENYFITNSLDETLGKTILGNNTNKKCRFCGKDNKSTTFKKKAHIIPEFMGNKLFFSNYECDTCNDYIGNLEDSLSNFAGIFNSLSTIKGKRGYPKFKDKKEGLETFANDEKTVISRVDSLEDMAIVYDKEKQKMNFNVNQPGYIPQDAFKALVKIGLLMMSDEEFKNYYETVKWINTTKYSNQENNPVFNVFRKIGGKKRFIQPWCILLKKRNGDNMSNYPSHSLLIFYGILTYQIFIPFNKNDENLFENNKIFLALSERVIREKNKTDKSVEVIIDRVSLGNPEKVKSEKKKFSFGFKEDKNN